MIYNVKYHSMGPECFDKNRLVGLFDFTARFFAEDGTPFSQDTRMITLSSVYDTRFDNAYFFYNLEGKRVFHRYLRVGWEKVDSWAMRDVSRRWGYISRTELREIWDAYKNMSMHYSQLKMGLYLMQRGGAPLPASTIEFLRLHGQTEIRWVQLAELFCRLHVLETLGRPFDIDLKDHNFPAYDWILEHDDRFANHDCVGQVEDALNTWNRVGHNAKEYLKTLPPVRLPTAIATLSDDEVRQIRARRRAASDAQRHIS